MKTSNLFVPLALDVAVPAVGQVTNTGMMDTTVSGYVNYANEPGTLRNIMDGFESRAFFSRQNV